MNFKAENNEFHHGFQMTFQNGCTISVQFNGRNYCDEGKTTAEVAAWNSDGEWMVYDDNKWVVLIGGETDVMSHQTPDDVSKLIYTLSNVIWKHANIEKQH
jgi:hypothetical protein